MNDFDYDVLTKKRLAKNSYAKKGTRGGKTCRLPDDYLTPKQRRELNGPTKHYKLGGPMDWSTFRSMPDDLQREYMQKLIEQFHASDALLGEMFGVKNVAVGRRRKELGITRSGRMRPAQAQRDAFYEWCAGETGTANPADQNAPEPEPEDAPNPEPAPAPKPTVRVTSGSFTVTGTAREALELLSMMFRDDPHTGTFTLQFTFDKEDING